MADFAEWTLRDIFVGENLKEQRESFEKAELNAYNFLCALLSSGQNDDQRYFAEQLFDFWSGKGVDASNHFACASDYKRRNILFSFLGGLADIYRAGDMCFYDECEKEAIADFFKERGRTRGIENFLKYLRDERGVESLDLWGDGEQELTEQNVKESIVGIAGIILDEPIFHFADVGGNYYSPAWECFDYEKWESFFTEQLKQSGALA